MPNFVSTPKFTSENTNAGGSITLPLLLVKICTGYFECEGMNGL